MISQQGLHAEARLLEEGQAVMKGIVGSGKSEWGCLWSQDGGHGNCLELSEEAKWWFMAVIGSNHQGRKKCKNIIGQILTEDFGVLLVGHQESSVISFLGQLGGAVLSIIWLPQALLGDHWSKFDQVYVWALGSFLVGAEEAGGRRWCLPHRLHLARASYASE
jgi:hypothetical protein